MACDWGDFSDVYAYLSENIYPEGLNKDAKRALRQKAQSFAVEGGILMHRSGDKLCRVVVDVTERDRIVASLHADPIGGNHYGQTATIRKVTYRFWWRHVTSDTTEYVRSCVVCQKANPVNKPPPATLHPVPVGGLFHRWGIDLIGPLTETTTGNKYVAVATEYLTRWPEVTVITVLSVMVSLLLDSVTCTVHAKHLNTNKQQK